MKQIYMLLFASCLLAVQTQAKSLLSIQQQKLAIAFNNKEDGGKNGLVITPNPSTGDALIHFSATKAFSALIEVLDEKGKSVISQQAELFAGKNKININQFILLVEGTYTIRLTTNSKTYSSSFLMWK